MSDHVDLTGLVRTLIEPIVEFKDDLAIEEVEAEDGVTVIEVRVNEADAGKVIGRQGRVIKAVRTLVHAAAMRADERVEVELID